MKKLALGIASFTMLAMVGTALAQTPAPVKSGQIGLITVKDGILVTLKAKSGTRFVNAKQAGEGCKLRTDDKIEVVSLVDGASVIVKRLRYIGVPRGPELKTTCPTGSLVELKVEQVVAAIKAQEAADAAKAAKAPPKKS